MRVLTGLTVAGLGCWVLIFLAGTDVWHDTGSPDFWSLSGPPYTDLRIAAYAFYFQLVVWVAQLALELLHLSGTKSEGSDSIG